MYYELTWLGVGLLVLGLLVFVGPAVHFILRARRERSDLSDRRSNHRRRLGLDGGRS